MKVSKEMLQLAEHIVDTKADEFKPDEFVDHYEEALAELLKKAGREADRQSGRQSPLTARRQYHRPAEKEHGAGEQTRKEGQGAVAGT